MKKKTILLTLAAAVCVAAAAGGWWFVDAREQQSLVAAALPPPPDLTSGSAVMREHVATAEARARSLRFSRAGLAELARLYHANGFPDAAMQCYENLARLEPAEPQWLHLHATILAGYGDIAPALALWQRVVELAPDYTPARLRIGDSLLKSNRLDEASAAYTAVLERAPGDAYALLGLARIDLEAQRWDQAREKLEAVVRQTNYQLGYDLIVSLYERLGQHDRATAIRGATQASGAYRDPPDAWVDALIDVCHDSYQLSLAAGVAGRNSAPAKARELLERAIEIAPNDVSARFQLGTFSLAQGDFKTARDQFERCTVLAPDFSDGWAQLSGLQAQLGEAAAAERTLSTGLRQCPDSPGLHLMRARNLRQAGRAEESLNEYLISISLRPNEPDAYIELGNTLIALGREAEGIARLRQSLESDPANPMALGILTFHAISTGNEAEARRWMARVANQPRVSREHATQLRQLYRQRFGQDWRP